MMQRSDLYLLAKQRKRKHESVGIEQDGDLPRFHLTKAQAVEELYDTRAVLFGLSAIPGLALFGFGVQYVTHSPLLLTLYLIAGLSLIVWLLSVPVKEARVRKKAPIDIAYTETQLEIKLKDVTHTIPWRSLVSFCALRGQSMITIKWFDQTTREVSLHLTPAGFEGILAGIEMFASGEVVGLPSGWLHRAEQPLGRNRKTLMDALANRRLIHSEMTFVHDRRKGSGTPKDAIEARSRIRSITIERGKLLINGHEADQFGDWFEESMIFRVGPAFYPVYLPDWVEEVWYRNFAPDSTPGS